jgi:hypothetical protein
MLGTWNGTWNKIRVRNFGLRFRGCRLRGLLESSRKGLRSLGGEELAAEAFAHLLGLDEEGSDGVQILTRHGSNDRGLEAQPADTGDEGLGNLEDVEGHIRGVEGEAAGGSADQGRG